MAMMTSSSISITRSIVFFFFFFAFQVVMYTVAVRTGVSDATSNERLNLQRMPNAPEIPREFQGCQHCNDREESSLRANSNGQHNSFKPNENIDITATYLDASGNVKVYTVKSNDLSSSWMWGNSADEKYMQRRKGLEQRGSSLKAVYGKQEGENTPRTQEHEDLPVSPVKLRRQVIRKRRKEARTALLTQMGRDAELHMVDRAIENSRQLDTTLRGKYSIWRREYQNPNSDSILKLMKDQIIMAKVYASIARSEKNRTLHDTLVNQMKESQDAIGDANSDDELQPGALEKAKAMGHILSTAKESLYECDVVARKLRAMIQSTEENINAMKKQSTFLIQHAAKTIPKPLHCLPLQLTTDYFLRGYKDKELADKQKLDDPSLYHYAIFSDNVLATSVVVNSTISKAREPEKHVFHIVTDKLNFAAMKMWFIVHPPSNATVNVENIDEFKWLNSSYCSVLRQLESSRLKEYYFKANHPSSLSAGNDNLKYRNPKYLSMLNHLRFYMPEVYPKLDKILFLDDDVVVQKDLTPLWFIDMKGMVNGAVETCKESFHRFETYLNFSNPKISKNFDPQACGWAFGMNIFDLKEWKKRNITGIYHYWQDLNEDRTLWKLGSLPPGLITFYNLTYPLDRSWHVLGLGYDPAINLSEIDKAAVVHYNGNYKPWLDLAISKYKSYWSKFVKYDNPHLQVCNIHR